MQKTETLVKELINAEKELRHRNPREVCKAIEKISKKQNISTTCLNCFYQGYKDLYEEE